MLFLTPGQIFSPLQQLLWLARKSIPRSSKLFSTAYEVDSRPYKLFPPAYKLSRAHGPNEPKA